MRKKTRINSDRSCKLNITLTGERLRLRIACPFSAESMNQPA